LNVRAEQLEYLEVVVRVGSFRRAAAELHLSQAALSETVRNLERELGVELVTRGRSGVQLSPEGAHLMPLVRASLEAIDDLRRGALDQQHGGLGALRMGTVNAATAPIVAPSIQRFSALHPTTKFEVIGGSTIDLQRSMGAGELDLALVTYLDGDHLPPELETTVLLRGRMVVYFRADHPFAAQRQVSLDDLVAQPQAVMRPGFTMHRLLRGLLRGAWPATTFAADSAEMAKLMVTEGLGVCAMPDFTIVGDPLERHGVLSWRPLTGVDERMTLAIARPRSRYLSKTATDLHDVLVDQARRYDEARLGTGDAGAAA
jgi:DNA-binding transcriptional LysR family regulator